MFILIIKLNNALKFDLLRLDFGYFTLFLTRIMKCILDHAFNRSIICGDKIDQFVLISQFFAYKHIPHEITHHPLDSTMIRDGNVMIIFNILLAAPLHYSI